MLSGLKSVKNDVWWTNRSRDTAYRSEVDGILSVMLVV